jgi:hypothetical protein
MCVNILQRRPPEQTHDEGPDLPEDNRNDDASGSDAAIR